MYRSKRLSSVTVFAILSFAGLPVVAEEAERLPKLLSEHVLPLRLVDGEPVGPGAELILAEARAAEFFVIGESHGNRETPQLTASWLTDLRGHGYEAFGVEVGPVTAGALVDLVRSSEPDPFKRFLTEYPFSFPFFWWREEEAMLRRAVDEGYVIWGLDQEFIGAGRPLLDRLAELLAETSSSEQVEAWRQLAAAGFEAFASSGSTDQAFLNVVSIQSLDLFLDTFPAASLEAREIVRELRDSAEVYQHYQAERYYLNNRDRVRLMKRHLREAMSRTAGKAVIKLGSVHSGRGRSPMMQLDIGNAAAELAVARGADSFHLLIYPRLSIDADGKETDWAEDAPYLALLDAHRAGDDWAVFDLRELRPYFAVRSHREQDPDLSDIVFRFDALLLAPVFHAATETVPLS